MRNIIQAATSKPAPKQESVNAIISSILDQNAMRKRFDELLGKRAPQFISSIVSLVNATPALQKAIYEAPMTVVQAALKAAAYDLPIDSSLGYAYIVPFNNTIRDLEGTQKKRAEAAFILGYKGMHQLAMRTGAYKTINVMDVREGELKSYNRLTEEISLDFIEDEDEREAAPIIGWVGYFRLLNGTEKTIYMSRKQIEAHEKKHRKGQYMGKVWKDDFDAMARKTVYRQLIGRWGLMSIDYQSADAHMIKLAEAVATGKLDDQMELDSTIIENESAGAIDTETGEVIDVVISQEAADA